MFSVGCVALLIGVVVPQYGITLDSPLFWAALLFIAAAVFRRFALLMLVFASVGCFLIGMQRGATTVHQLQKYESLYDQEVILSGVVSDDVAVHEARHQQEFHLGSIRYHDTALIGRVQVRTFEDIRLSRGDAIVVRGVLHPSKGTTRQGHIRTAQIVRHVPTNSVLERFRQNFFGSVKRLLPEPQASLGLGYVVGLRVSLPDDVNEQLKIVGLTHIIAVSGYNLTILVQAARKLFAKRSAYQAVVAAGLLTIGFVVIAGGSASINRAAVVCGLSLLAWYYGREFKPLLLLLLSGVITGLYNPLYVWGDPGWYLSFLAFSGILLLAPLVTARYFKEREPRAGVQILLETICAQICTIPYTMYLFGSVSIIAPIANLLVLPIIPFIMVCIALLGVLGIFSPTIAGLFSFIPTSLLSLQLWLVQQLSSVSWAHREVSITRLVMVALFMAIVFYILLLRHRLKLEKAEEITYTNSSN